MSIDENENNRCKYIVVVFVAAAVVEMVHSGNRCVLTKNRWCMYIIYMCVSYRTRKPKLK